MDRYHGGLESFTHQMVIVKGKWYKCYIFIFQIITTVRRGKMEKNILWFYHALKYNIEFVDKITTFCGLGK